ncbi:DUF3885 domain-containing protein [Streptomyces filamentosus]|uniref:DUF3885 domain-containing protein n=1 Tax=Streptomyces filamentosus TaxID=67294 RepID=UPI003B5179AA
MSRTHTRRRVSTCDSQRQLSLRRDFCHPYDGGADVFLATPEERDRTRDRYPDWLSSHPSGL